MGVEPVHPFTFGFSEQAVKPVCSKNANTEFHALSSVFGFADTLA